MCVLYMIDNFSASGGAHVAIKRLIKKHFQCGDEVGIVHLDELSDCQKEEYKEVNFYHFPLLRNSLRWFCQRVIYKFLHSAVFPCWLIDPFGKIRRIMQSYDVVCVTSEESTFKSLLLKVNAPVKKVLLIHTNYDLWLSKVPDAFKHTWRDKAIFRAVDRIGVVGAIGAQQLRTRFPECATKIFPFYNLMEFNNTHQTVKSRESDCLRMISLVRVDDKASKDCDRMIRVARKLKELGVKFIWDVYGGAEAAVEQYREDAADICDMFCLHGHVVNAKDKIKNADFMILLSHYEGLPNVIYESLIAGTPVFSTNVGGIPEQIVDGVTGWLVDDDEDVILDRLCLIANNPQCVDVCFQYLGTYVYDNNHVWDNYLKLLN